MSFTDSRLSMKDIPVSDAPTTTIRVLLFTFTLPKKGKMMLIHMDFKVKISVCHFTHHFLSDDRQGKWSLFLIESISFTILDFC